MKTALDPSQPRRCRYTLFATTTHEFNRDVRYNADESIGTRFAQIDVKPLPEEIMLDILLRQLNQEAPEFEVSFEVLSHLYSQVESRPQRGEGSLTQNCRSVLSEAIRLTQAKIQDVLEKCTTEIAVLSYRIELLNIEVLKASGDPALEGRLRADLERLKAEHEQTKSAKEEREALVKEWDRICRHLKEISRKTYEMMVAIERIARVADGVLEVRDATKKRELELLVTVVLPRLRQEKARIGRELGNVHIIDRALVDEAIARNPYGAPAPVAVAVGVE
jgi:hypothetical protein